MKKTTEKEKIQTEENNTNESDKSNEHKADGNVSNKFLHILNDITTEESETEDNIEMKPSFSESPSDSPQPKWSTLAIE